MIGALASSLLEPFMAVVLRLCGAVLMRVF